MIFDRIKLNKNVQQKDSLLWELDSCEFIFKDTERPLPAEELSKVIDGFCKALDFSVTADLLIDAYRAVGRTVSRVVFYFSHDLKLISYKVI